MNNLPFKSFINDYDDTDLLIDEDEVEFFEDEDFPIPDWEEDEPSVIEVDDWSWLK